MVLKLLPLQGDRLAGIKSPGRCPGLGASALSGRVALTYEVLSRACGAKFYQGRVALTCEKSAIHNPKLFEGKLLQASTQQLGFALSDG